VAHRAGDPDHRDDADRLQYRRIRGVWNPTDRLMGQFRRSRLARALQIALHPELDAVRVHFDKMAIGVGEAVPTGEVVWTTERSRGRR
jgi:hypothetical protein